MRPESRRMMAAIDQTQREQARAGRRSRSLWVRVTQVGTLGWLLALPIIGGALLGHVVDRWLGTGSSFALALLGLGLVLAGYLLWRQITQLEAETARDTE